MNEGNTAIAGVFNNNVYVIYTVVLEIYASLNCAIASIKHSDFNWDCTGLE